MLLFTMLAVYCLFVEKTTNPNILPCFVLLFTMDIFIYYEFAVCHESFEIVKKSTNPYYNIIEQCLPIIINSLCRITCCPSYWYCCQLYPMHSNLFLMSSMVSSRLPVAPTLDQRLEIPTYTMDGQVISTAQDLLLDHYSPSIHLN